MLYRALVSVCFCCEVMAIIEYVILWMLLICGLYRDSIVLSLRGYYGSYLLPPYILGFTINSCWFVERISRNPICQRCNMPNVIPSRPPFGQL